jgi:hypothetical protein
VEHCQLKCLGSKSLNWSTRLFTPPPLGDIKVLSRARRLHTYSPAGGFDALTFAGAQVKDESTPRRAWESRPGTAPPTPMVRPSPPLCDVVRSWPATIPWHCATHSRTADVPHPRKRTAEPSKGRRTTTPRPHKDNTVTLGRRDRSPPLPSVLCDHPRRPQHRPRHCNTIPNTVGAGRQDAATPAAVRPVASRQPHPRVHVRAMTKQAIHTTPPSKPLVDGYRARHDAPPDIRFARTTVYSTTLYTMPLHVDKQCRTLVNCRLLGL